MIERARHDGIYGPSISSKAPSVFLNYWFCFLSSFGFFSLLSFPDFPMYLFALVYSVVFCMLTWLIHVQMAFSESIAHHRFKGRLGKTVGHYGGITVRIKHWSVSVISVLAVFVVQRLMTNPMRC